MNIADEIIYNCMGESIEKIYPYFVYQQGIVFHFFDNAIIPNANGVYYGKAWCKHSFEHPFRKSLVPLNGDRIRSTNGEVIEIVHLVLA